MSYERIQTCTNTILAPFRIHRNSQQTTLEPTVQPPFHNLPAPADMGRLHCTPRQRRWIKCSYVLLLESLLVSLLIPCSRNGNEIVLYGFSLAYLIAPGTFDSTHVVEFVAGLPDAVKYAGKAILAAPFAFHSFNGLRHLGWDMGRCMSFDYLFGPWRHVMNLHSRSFASTMTVLTVKGAYASGYAVLGATALSTVALVLM